MRKLKTLSKLIPAIGLTLAAAEARAQLVYEPFAYGTSNNGQELGKQGANFSTGGFTNPQNGFNWFDTANTFSGTVTLGSGDVVGPLGGVAPYGNGSVSSPGSAIIRAPRLQVAGLGLKTGAAYYSMNLNVTSLPAG